MFIPSIVTEHNKLLESVLLVYTGAISPQNITNNIFNISRQKITNVVNAMPKGLESDIVSKTKRLERSARNIIGNPISIYTPEELKSAMFAFAGGEYSYAMILAEFGVGDTTLRKKIQALRKSMQVSKLEFDQIMITDSCRIQNAIETMSYPKRGNQDADSTFSGG